MAGRKPNLSVVGGPGPASATMGHNQMSDDQARALHLSNHVPAYEKALAAKKKADADFKNVCKTIKSEGGNIDDIKLTIKLRTPEGEKEFKEQIERQRRIAQWNNLPIGGQGWLLDEDRRPLSERAYEDGKKAGLEGNDASPPKASRRGPRRRRSYATRPRIPTRPSTTSTRQPARHNHRRRRR